MQSRKGRRTIQSMGPPVPPIPADSLETKLKWWCSLQDWLHHLQVLVDESLSKDFEEMIQRRHPLTDGKGCLAEMQMAIHRKYKKRRERKRTQLLFCNYEPYSYFDPSYYCTSMSPSGLMNYRTIPTAEDVAYISGFVDAQESHLYIHWEHLDYLSWEIIPKLISQVEDKIEDLKMIMEFRVPDFEAGMPPRGEAENDYCTYTDTEEEFSDYLDDDEHSETVTQHFDSDGRVELEMTKSKENSAEPWDGNHT